MDRPYRAGKKKVKVKDSSQLVQAKNNRGNISAININTGGGGRGFGGGGTGSSSSSSSTPSSSSNRGLETLLAQLMSERQRPPRVPLHPQGGGPIGGDDQTSGGDSGGGAPPRGPSGGVAPPRGGVIPPKREAPKKRTW